MTKEDILKLGFFGNRRWLSNFHIHNFISDGIYYSSIEGFYQSHKTLDLKHRAFIAGLGPGDAKEIGNTTPLREDWEEIKLSIMKKGLEHKFPGHGKLSDMLLDTGDEELVEHNWWHDKFWGVHFGVGENHLGRLLMERREELKRL